MRPQKGLPRRRSLRHGRDALRLEDPSNRRSPNAVSEILQRAADPGIAPRRVLLGHPDHQLPNLYEYATPTALPLRVRPLTGDQQPMPPENRVGRDDPGDL